MTTQERVKKVVAEVMRVAEASVDTNVRLEELGETDSLTMAEIATALDAEFAVRVPSEDLAGARSVADLTSVVERLVGQT